MKSGYKWNPEKLRNHKGMLGKSHKEYARNQISKAQKGRKHQLHEGFQKGHSSFTGTEATRFNKGQRPWNYGTKGQKIDPAKYKLRTYRANAKKANRQFEVTLEQMREFLNSRCIYCGEQATGIDRLDNTKGYIEGNMTACCGVCNHMKNNLSEKQFINKIKQIANRI